MNVAARRRLATLMGRAVLLAGILAIVAGILGMHTLTGNHAAHTLGAGAPPSYATAAPTGHGPSAHNGHGSGAHSHSAPSSVVRGEPAAYGASAVACSDTLGSTESPAVACTPLAKAGSLSAPEPGSAGQLADARVRSGVGTMRFYPYLPDGPSPGDLSISRT
ncbi:MULTISPECIES: hypothetical protein [unclassified Pseudarthrobacter]|uniref:hypothetical protein n=1 Tax=unclassified Pseudarthrobacter TaxID=2647000 RepID=UPI00307834D9